MPTPLLETKLYAPRVRGTSVTRPRLIERLDRPDSKLVLVSAPAGFGKTTLLTQWLQPESPETASVAWVSLDSGDNDPATFWAYVVAALRTALRQVAPELGAGELQLLRSPDPPSAVRLLTPLLNDLDALGHDVVLALDDYHVIDGAEVHEGVSFLLDHAPPTLHLLIASRVDPPLPLARLRARGELTEVRVADLRFTAEEAAEYLNGPMGLSLSQSQVAALEGRTEGWIAALQLAGLSLQGRDDTAGFIGAFTGDDRYIVDYLLEEVLDRQPDHVARFLLQTSLLSRLTGPLCDAVTGQAGGRTALESLDRANLFVVPLDDHRRWYRYHHLFADVLRARLLDEQPELVPILHRRAGDWYEAHGLRSESIHHALAAGDYGRAAELIERTIPAARRDRTDAALRAWLDQLPEEVVRVRPVLSLAYAGALLSTGRVEGVEEHLANVERGIAARDDDGTVVVDEELYRSLPGWVALYRAAHALLLGDTSTTVAFAHDGLDLLEDDDHIGHAAGSAMLGLASWAQGDLEAAHAAYTRCQQTFHDSGYRSDILGCAITLADIRITQGRLRDAMGTYQEALRLAAVPPAASEVELRGTVDMYVGMAELHREHNDLAEAARLLERARALGEHAGLPQSRYRWHVAMARVRQVEGDLDAASAHLDEAELSFDTDFGPEVRPIMALRARLWLAQGRVGDALAWASSHGVSADGEVSYRGEYEHVTLARALLAQFVRTRDEAVYVEATQLLGRLLLAAEDGGRTGTMVEILALQAVACHHHGNDAEALKHLERALAIAEPEGYVRIFLDEGPAMLELMQSAATAGIATSYVRAILPDAESPVRRGDGALVEPLSERERDVLRLLMTELTGPDIARELVLSLNTVRSHTKSIYAKLGVSSRRAAVRRAQELDLLAR